jgi:hypothetical protein
MPLSASVAPVIVDCAFTMTACGDEAGPEPSPQEEISPSAEAAYLKEARHWSGSVEGSDQGKDKTLLAIGRDWCRWRNSPSFGDISEDQFFDEILVDPSDGAGIRRAAEEHLCPS